MPKIAPPRRIIDGQEFVFIFRTDRWTYTVFRNGIVWLCSFASNIHDAVSTVEFALEVGHE